MNSVTFKRVAPEESRIYGADGDYVGDVYAQDDILNPGSRVYVVHLSEDPRASFACTSATAFARSPRNGFAAIRSLHDAVMVRSEDYGRVASRPGFPLQSPVAALPPISTAIPRAFAPCGRCALALPWNNHPRKLPSAGDSGGTAARISVSHTGSRTAPRHQCPNADCGPGQTCIRATRTTARTASLPETNTLYTIPRTHAASCCSLRVRAPAPPGWKLAGSRPGRHRDDRGSGAGRCAQGGRAKSKQYSSRCDGASSHTCSLRQPLRGPPLRCAPLRPGLAGQRRWRA